MFFDLTEEQLAVKEAAREFAQKELKPGVIERDSQMKFPTEEVKKMAELGFLGMMVDPQYGGGGMDTLSYVLAMEEIAKEVTINISHAVEILAAIIIGVAVIKTSLNYFAFIRSSKISKEEIRVQFGSSVAVSLELLLGADVLATAVAPGPSPCLTGSCSIHRVRSYTKLLCVSCPTGFLRAISATHPTPWALLAETVWGCRSTPESTRSRHKAWH